MNIEEKLTKATFWYSDKRLKMFIIVADDKYTLMDMNSQIYGFFKKTHAKKVIDTLKKSDKKWNVKRKLKIESRLI